MKRWHVVVAVLFFVLNSACSKKDGPAPDKEEQWDYSAEAYLKDSTLYYTKLLSLWQNYIDPRNINDILDSNKVRAITKNFEDSESVLDYLIGQTPTGVNNQPIDRFSFIDREDAVSDEIQNARVTGFGLSVIYLLPSANATNADLYVKLVDRNSAADLAGLKRGDKILSINGNTNIDYNSQRAKNFADVLNALYSNTITLKWQTPSNEIIEKTLTSTRYNYNPINAAKIFTLDNSNKVGYIAFSSFVSIVDRNGPTALFSDFEQIFNTFEQQQVKDLIIDLRYNGGGDVQTAEYLANRVAPASATGKRMYSYKLNPIVQEELGEYFPAVNFIKRGNLELNKVYFLVTSSTASASELLINSLAPYMDVQIIGSENTYGKPVGFWGTPLKHKNKELTLYVTSFQMFNANNFGDYFAGLQPNKLANESFSKQLGDETEGFIAEALHHIRYGSYSSASKVGARSTDKTTYKLEHQALDIHSKGMFKMHKRSPKL